MEFSPMTSWMHYSPFPSKKRKGIQITMEQGILSGELSCGCPRDKRDGADAAARWLQGRWARTHSPVAGAPSLCPAVLLPPLGRCALLLWAHKEYTGSPPVKAPLPLSTVCIFPRKRGKKKSALQGHFMKSPAGFLRVFFSKKAPQFKLDFSSVVGGKAIPHGREKWGELQSYTGIIVWGLGSPQTLGAQAAPLTASSACSVAH